MNQATVIQSRAGNGVSPFSLRMPVGLHAAIKNEAMARGQSVNTMIVMTMQKEIEAAAQK